MTAPTRPVLRWHGGKWLLAPWIISHFPEHRVYVEPYGGAASVLMRKEPAYAEIYNDLDKEVVSLFRILRDQFNCKELTRRLELTPFARLEFESAYCDPSDDMDRARKLIIRSFMGFGSDCSTSQYRGGFRANSNRSGSTPAHDWVNYSGAIQAFTKRLSGVVVENRPAIDVMRAHDTSDTLHYVDPPYVHDTRSGKARGTGKQKYSYRHELSDEDHAELLEALCELEGMVVLSGYPHALYSETLLDWHRVERKALADGARERTEVLWLNPACWGALRTQRAQGELLEALV